MLVLTLTLLWLANRLERAMNYSGQAGGRTGGPMAGAPRAAGGVP
jgi:hypothetical protein